MRQIVLNGKAQAAADRAGRAMTPVEKVLHTFGAARAGALVGLTTEAVRKWNRSQSTGGGGGLIPSRYQDIYLQAARAEGLALTAADFIAAPKP